MILRLILCFLLALVAVASSLFGSSSLVGKFLVFPLTTTLWY